MFAPLHVSRDCAANVASGDGVLGWAWQSQRRSVSRHPVTPTSPLHLRMPKGKRSMAPEGPDQLLDQQEIKGEDDEGRQPAAKKAKKSKKKVQRSGASQDFENGVLRALVRLHPVTPVTTVTT